MFYLISKDPMTQYLLRIEKSFCNDNFMIDFLLFFTHFRPHNDAAIVIGLMGSINSRICVSSLTLDRHMGERETGCDSLGCGVTNM
jgi:hypothetical protein